jgi:thermostable 8-oxoguanine DNA glycosylase
MWATFGGSMRRLALPSPDQHVLPGVRWGRFDELFTPAFWRGQAWQHRELATYRCMRLGTNLVEEAAACLLGGYGMHAELGLAAFRRLRDRGLLAGAPSRGTFEDALAEPFGGAIGARRYRFPRQKARYLAVCVAELGRRLEPEGDLALRNLLLTLPGIGPKTASWIVRNHRASSAVAIIDVHILRAGRLIGIFREEQQPGRDYDELERAFLRFAAAIEVPAAILDALMWDYMRALSNVALGRPAERRKAASKAQASQLILFPAALHGHRGPAGPFVAGDQADGD